MEKAAPSPVESVRGNTDDLQKYKQQLEQTEVQLRDAQLSMVRITAIELSMY